MRVLDLSRLLPGPYCSLILADFGFEVIKVERPKESDWVRQTPPLDPEAGESMLFRALNRGKKSLTLNLKADQGRDILLQLVETADVLLESFRPGVMERLGLGYEQLADVNDRLVYCSLSGYGQEGPYRDRAGHDLNYVGLSGLLDLTGPLDGPPAILGAQVADIVGALWAAVGILMALHEREHTRKGQRVNASLFGGVLSCLPLAVASQQGGQPMKRGGSVFTGGVICYNVYRARDGYVTIAALEPGFWAAFCGGIGREDLISQQYAPAVAGEPAYDELCALFETRSRQEWVESLASVDSCFEPVYTVAESLVSAPGQALGIVARGGLLPPVRLSGRAMQPALQAPALGEHTSELLNEVGYTEKEITELRDSGIIV